VVRCGDVHLTIRLADGTLTLTPEWMLRPAAAGCEIRSAPRLCVARLRDLRAYLDAVLGSYDGDSPLTDGADHASEPPTTGSSRPRKTLSAADFGVIWAIERIWSCRDLRLMGEKAGNFVCGVAAALSSNRGL
jgi:hypothetical protein